MITIPVIRWGQPYESLETETIKHFITGEPVAKLGMSNAGLVARDMKKAQRARDVLREIPIRDLIQMMKKAGELYLKADLPLGNGTQSPDDFVKQQSASTGLPHHLARGNMTKNHFVLSNMDRILDCLTRGLDPDILTRGYGEEGRGVTVSYQANSPVLGMVLPSNSPGVHTLWLPVVAMQIGLVMKPGSQEPWTPYRMMAAFFEAGIPREAISIYPGHADVGGEVASRCGRVMLFGGASTIDKYRGNPGVQVHGPGYSKILIGDDKVDQWEKYIDVIADSIYLNSGRGCINCSGVWASRHTEEIAQALAEKLGPIAPLPPEDPNAKLAAFTVAGQAQAINESLLQMCKEAGVTDMTAKFGQRLVELEHSAYLRPWIVHCNTPDVQIANKEYMFPFTSVVKCPQAEMISKIGPTLVGTVISEDKKWSQELLAATHIDRLNLGPIPTIKLDWLQPHEGNIVDFLFRARAFQMPAVSA